MVGIHDENDGLLDMVPPTESHDASKLNFIFLITKYNKIKTKHLEYSQITLIFLKLYY